MCIKLLRLSNPFNYIISLLYLSIEELLRILRLKSAADSGDIASRVAMDSGYTFEIDRYTLLLREPLKEMPNLPMYYNQKTSTHSQNFFAIHYQIRDYSSLSLTSPYRSIPKSSRIVLPQSV